MGMLAVMHTANTQIFILRCHPSQTEPISKALMFYLSGEKLLYYVSGLIFSSFQKSLKIS